MSTENFDLPLVNGSDSFKASRDLNNLSRAVDETLHQVNEQLDGRIETLAGVGIFAKDYPKLVPEYDDSPRFKRAIDAAIAQGVHKLILTESSYVFNTSIDMTDIRNGLVLEGRSEGTVLVGNTGGICLDLTGSQKTNLKNIRIVGGETNPSTIGVLYARSTDNIYAEFNTLENIEISLPSVPSANSGIGTIGIYNFSSEIGAGHDITIDADLPVVLTNKNIFNVASAFTTIHPVGVNNISMSEWAISGHSTLRPKTKCAVLLDNVLSIDIDAYVLLDGDREVASEYAFIIKNTCFNLSFKGHVENFKKSILLDGDTPLGTYVTDLNVHFTKQIFGNHDQIVLDGRVGTTGVYGSDLNVVPTSNTITHNAIVQLGTNHIGIMNSKIILNERQGMNTPVGKTTSNLIKAFEAYPTVNLSTFSNGTIVQRQDRTQVLGELHTEVHVIGGRYLLGGKVHAWGGGIPVEGTWSAGDRIVNNYPLEQGTAGSKYIVSEWICTVSGTPGIWLPLRALTGN